jgi:O-acetyl-ADP-ribose deacetylase (regulator of RNase III)
MIYLTLSSNVLCLDINVTKELYMIKEVSGDILLTKAEATAHGIAPMDDFKHGLALSIRERWPALYKDFRHYCHTKNPAAGTIWTWGGAGHTRVVNLLTQDAPDSPSGHAGKAQTKYVNHALKELRKEIEKEGFKSVALPRLATGVGGLDWNEVKPLIEQHLGDLNIPVIVYTEYHKNQAADEGL